MKKALLGFVGLCMAGNVAIAQELYVRLGLGYALPQAGQSTYDTPIPYYEFASAYNGSRVYNANGTETYNIKPASLSAGLQSVLGIGYMFTPNIGVQLDAGIGLSAKKYSFNDENVPLSSGTTSIAYNITTTQQASTPVFMMPSLVLQTGGDQWNVYSRFGVALPLNTSVTEHQIFTNAPGTGSLQTDDFQWQVKSGFSLGFTAAAGLKYKISDKVSVWGELNLLSISVYTKEQDLKNWTEDGQSVALSNYNGPQTIKFSKTATTDSTYSQFPSYAQPFSNIGVHAGVTFTLSHHESRGKGGDEMIDHSKPFRRNN